MNLYQRDINKLFRVESSTINIILSQHNKTPMHNPKYQLALQQRHQRRQQLFEHNRNFAAQLAHLYVKKYEPNIQTQNSIKNQQTYVDPNYSVIIHTYLGQIRKPVQLSQMVKQLNTNNFVAGYCAVIGIHSLGSNLFNSDNEVEVMGTGIVPNLSKYLLMIDHPYLQLRSLEIMRRLIDNISRERFPIFFNHNLVPLACLLVLLNSDLSYINESCVVVMIKLVRHSYSIDCDNTKIELLDILSRLINKWRYYQRGLELILTFMKELQIYFWQSRIVFTEKYFSILFTLLQIQKQSSSRSNINSSIFSFMRSKKMLQRLSPVLSLDLPKIIQSYPNIYTCIHTLYNFELKDYNQDLDQWKSFIINLLHSKRGLNLLEQMNLMVKIEEYLSKSQEISIQVIMLEIYGCILRETLKIKSNNVEKVTSLINNQIVMSKLANAYKKASNKFMIKSLNYTVVQVLRSFKIVDCTKILREHELIKEYICNSSKFDNQTAKMAIKYLKQVIQNLKNKVQIGQKQYKQFVSLILTQQNYMNIIEMLRNNYLVGVEQIVKYFENLKHQMATEQQACGEPDIIDITDQIVSKDKFSLIRYKPETKKIQQSIIEPGDFLE